MIHIGITGKGSYIGRNFIDFMQKHNDYRLTEIDTVNTDFSQYDFSDFDVLFHVAGIAHKKETTDNAEQYYKVNRDLTKIIAEKAKEDGVNQFIFMSSMSVYGLSYSDKPVSIEDRCAPITNYGKSKLEAEKFLIDLVDETFKVCILRPPMVYGENSPGNLTKLLKMVQKVHIFPTLKNKRSCLSVDNLVYFVKECVDSGCNGIFAPQDPEYMCTVDIVREEMNKKGNKVIYISLFNPFIKLLIGKSTLITKVFGDLVYEK